MKKALIIWSVIAVVILAVIGSVFFLLFSDPVTSATLIVKQSPVFVDSGNGFEQVSGTVTLAKNAIVKTGEGAIASLVLFESSITMLESNTQVVLASMLGDAPKLKQESGSTFTKFTGLTGMKTLEIETPNAVATVRGTAYRLGPDGLRVLEGRVGLKPLIEGSTEEFVDGGNAYLSNESTWSMRLLTEDEKKEMLDVMASMISDMQSTRDALVFRNQRVLDMAQKQLNLTVDDIKRELARADAGELNVDEMLAQSPVQLPVLVRIGAMTKLIASELKVYNAQTN